MRTIAIINQKGGCGKTTTAVNLAACMARLGRRTLLVDMDPQGHCATGLAVPQDKLGKTTADVLGLPGSDDATTPVSAAAWEIATNFDLVPADVRLAGFEQRWAGVDGRESRLKQALAPVKGYRWCLLDCPPGIGLLTFNALVACDEVVIPVETGYFSLHGLSRMLETIEELKDAAGKDVVVRVLPTLYDMRTKLAREVLAELRARFGGYLMRSCVNFNTKLKEAASFGQPITEYDPGSRGYKDFLNLARELMDDGQASAAPHAGPGGTLSRPAELVLRARQLAQLQAGTFVRPTKARPPQPTPDAAPDVAPATAGLPPEPARPVVENRNAGHAGTVGPRFSAEPPADAADRLRRLFEADDEPRRPPAASTDDKLHRIYGVRQTGGAVEFRVLLPGARSASVAGDFNGWDARGTPLARLPDAAGTWALRLPLPTGRYRYRFIVDGRWVNDPHNLSVERNEFGEFNNVLDVA